MLGIIKEVTECLVLAKGVAGAPPSRKDVIHEGIEVVEAQKQARCLAVRLESRVERGVFPSLEGAGDEVVELVPSNRERVTDDSSERSIPTKGGVTCEMGKGVTAREVSREFGGQPIEPVLTRKTARGGHPPTKERSELVMRPANVDDIADFALGVAVVIAEINGVRRPVGLAAGLVGEEPTHGAAMAAVDGPKTARCALRTRRSKRRASDVSALSGSVQHDEGPSWGLRHLGPSRVTISSSCVRLHPDWFEQSPRF